VSYKNAGGETGNASNLLIATLKEMEEAVSLEWMIGVEDRLS
jgi:hypothetical protein